MSVFLIMTLIALSGESSTHSVEFDSMSACSQAADHWNETVRTDKFLTTKVKPIAFCTPNF
ncbi:conserved hypothetical protein [Vibrio phage 236O40-1]|nr:conserved hypothetical protein [Vibrio phage 236O40-1]